MKLIFDFDGVLLFNQEWRKGYLFPLLERRGITKDELDEYYKNVREVGFSIQKLLSHFSIEIKEEEIFKNITDFVNISLIDLIKILDKENCFIVTFGDEEFQIKKIERTNLEPFFGKIFATSGRKNTFIENICQQFPDEKVVFVDDMPQHFEDIELGKCKNLKTILYDENGLQKL